MVQCLAASRCLVNVSISSGFWVAVPDFQQAHHSLGQVPELLWLGWMMSQGPSSTMLWVPHLWAQLQEESRWQCTLAHTLTQIVHQSCEVFMPLILGESHVYFFSVLPQCLDCTEHTLMYAFIHLSIHLGKHHFRPGLWREGGARMKKWLGLFPVFEELTLEGNAQFILRSHSWLVKVLKNLKLYKTQKNS